MLIDYKKAFIDGLGLRGFQSLQDIKYEGYHKDMKSFKKDLDKIKERYKKENGKL